MRRVSGAVLASSICSRAAVTPAFVAVPPPAATSSSWHTAARSCSLMPVQSVRQEQDAGVKEEEEEEGTYGGDDQRRFWDTVVKVLRSELGAGENPPEDLSRVWGFVAHNRDGKAPPAEASPSYRATGLYFPGLEAKPWWDDRSEFSWLQDLEDAAPDIKREMEALERLGGARSYKGGTGEMSTVYDATRGWGTMRIRYMGRFGQPGVNYSLLPRTLAALRRLPLAPETAAFQRQLPGTGLPLHVDPSNFVLGCHVGVVVPPAAAAAAAAAAGAAGEEGSADGSADASAATAGDRRGGKGRGGANRNKRVAGGVGFGGGGGVVREKKAAGGESGGAGSTAGVGAVERSNGTGRDGGTERRERSGERAWIEVAGEKRHWELGRAFVFDPSFLHRTYNPTDGERVILNIDVWHPGLKEVEKTAIRRVCELVEQWNSRSGLFED
ncbi:unnamed protein product [Ectocarpus sp. CCAP 1310/34]|nr:unnamed protein product [Ectocarpus sp. CCAP 1310/34]